MLTVCKQALIQLISVWHQYIYDPLKENRRLVFLYTLREYIRHVLIYFPSHFLLLLPLRHIHIITFSVPNLIKTK